MYVEGSGSTYTNSPLAIDGLGPLSRASRLLNISAGSLGKKARA